jgi:hypothetical protein
VGRDYGEIQKTLAAMTLPTDPDTFAREMADYAKLGFDTVILMPPGDAPAQWIESTGTQISRRLADL